MLHTAVVSGGGGRENLALEMYDVIWNLFDLANMVGIDLETAFAKKIETNRSRKWSSP